MYFQTIYTHTSKRFLLLKPKEERQGAARNSPPNGIEGQVHLLID